MKDQEGELKPLAEREGLLIVHTWLESKSAKIPHRRAMWTELVSLIESGGLDAILCWHINRLVRNMEEGGKLVQLFVDGKLKEIKTPSGTYRTGDNILPLVIEAASATQYSLDLSRRVIVGHVGNFQRGGCNYKVPHGYRNERDPLNLKKGVVAKDDDRFVLVRKAWDLLLTGAFTVPEIVEIMNEQWLFRTRPTKKVPSDKLKYSSAQKLFRNPFYAGFVRYKGEIRAATHEPMITPDEYARAQEILPHRSSRRKLTPTRRYAFTGFMRCAYCGRLITGETKPINSSGQRWENYRCIDYQGSCTKMGMSATKVERKIMESLASVTIEPWFTPIVFGNILRSIDKQAEAIEGADRQRRATLSAVDTKLSKLTEMWLSGILTDAAMFKQKEDELKKERNAALLAAEESKLEVESMKANAKAIQSYVLFAHDQFLIAAPGLRRQIAMELADSYQFYGREKHIEIQVRQILTDVVAFGLKIKRKLAAVEPEIIRSYKEKTGAFAPASSFGGADEFLFDVPESILTGLRTYAFRNFHF